MTRFTGAVERLGAVDIAPMVAWITAIPFEDWPQQTRWNGVALRPAMVNDPWWHGMSQQMQPLVDQVLSMVPDTSPYNDMLSVVMPGQEIPPHVDKVAPDWLVRVHVPLTTDPASRFVVQGSGYHLQTGAAYLVNITAEHCVDNRLGSVPRVHFMMDLRAR